MTINAESFKGGSSGAGTGLDILSRPSLVGRERASPFSLLSQALFWRPRHLAASPALGYLPLIFWLMEAARPQRIVQFGVGDGVAYMGMCQAVERLGEVSTCLGFESPAARLPAPMRGEHDRHYPDFSLILEADPLKEAHRFKGEIDLLILNQDLESESVLLLRQDWAPRLSRRAAVLRMRPAGALFDREAGALFADRGESILVGPMSPGGRVMEILLYGEEQPERLRALAALHPGDAAHMAVRQAFNRLGQGVENAWRAEDLARERGGLHATAFELERQAEERARLRDLELLREEVGALEARLAQARRAEAALSEARQELELLQDEKGALEIRLAAERAAREERSGALEAQLAQALRAAAAPDLTERVAALELEKTALEAQLAEARAAHEERVEDIAVLTRRFTDAHAAARPLASGAIHEAGPPAAAALRPARAEEALDLEAAHEAALLEARRAAEAASRVAPAADAARSAAPSATGAATRRRSSFGAGTLTSLSFWVRRGLGAAPKGEGPLWEEAVRTEGGPSAFARDLRQKRRFAEAVEIESVLWRAKRTPQRLRTLAFTLGRREAQRRSTRPYFTEEDFKALEDSCLKAMNAGEMQQAGAAFAEAANAGLAFQNKA